MIIKKKNNNNSGYQNKQAFDQLLKNPTCCDCSPGRKAGDMMQVFVDLIMIQEGGDLGRQSLFSPGDWEKKLREKYNCFKILKRQTSRES